VSLIKSLDQITPADAARVGGKAYNCVRLKRMAIMCDWMQPKGKLNSSGAFSPDGKLLCTKTKIGSLEF
jgi:hypothetical protein